MYACAFWSWAQGQDPVAEKVLAQAQEQGFEPEDATNFMLDE